MGFEGGPGGGSGWLSISEFFSPRGKRRDRGEETKAPGRVVCQAVPRVMRVQDGGTTVMGAETVWPVGAERDTRGSV